MDYYKVENILEEEEKVKVAFSYDIDTFGFYINPSLNTIRKNVKADLPLFLIKFIIQNDFCSIVENPFQALKHDLEAEASHVNLKNRHFFSVSKHLADRNKLSELFFERIGSYIGYVLKTDFTEDDVSKLSFGEKRLIIKARKSFRKFQDFSNNTSDDACFS